MTQMLTLRMPTHTWEVIMTRHVTHTEVIMTLHVTHRERDNDTNAYTQWDQHKVTGGSRWTYRAYATRITLQYDNKHVSKDEIT